MDTDLKIIITQQQKEQKIKKSAMNWNFEPFVYDHDTQVTMIPNILTPPQTNQIIYSTMKQQILKKISGYKQQDVKKHRFDPSQFITMEHIIQTMTEQNMLCRYCNKKVYLIYDISREQSQWTIDRIDNLQGHNIDNYCISCLTCNLSKRKGRDDTFFLKKNMVIIKLNDNV